MNSREQSLRNQLEEAHSKIEKMRVELATVKDLYERMADAYIEQCVISGELREALAEFTGSLAMFDGNGIERKAK